MDLNLTMRERSALRKLAGAGGTAPTVAAAAAILLARDAGGSYRAIGAAAGRTGAYAHIVCKQFVAQGRMRCPVLSDTDVYGNPKRPYPGRGNG